MSAKVQPFLTDPEANIHGKKILLGLRRDSRVLGRLREDASSSCKNVFALNENTRPHANRIIQERIVELG